MVQGDAKSILEAAMNLPPEQRVDIADRLLSTLPESYRDEVERLWAEEAERRLDIIKRGEVEMLDGEPIIRALERGECP